jgi:hypothetical protein
MESIYSIFETNKDIERDGFALEYGPSTFILARAGGSNDAYQRCVDRKMRPYRSAINSGTAQESTLRKVMAEAYSEKVVKAWDGVADRDGVEIPFSQENCLKLLLDLPDLFDELIKESQRIANFVVDSVESDVKG